jgi:hypothetical protein
MDHIMLAVEVAEFLMVLQAQEDLEEEEQVHQEMLTFQMVHQEQQTRVVVEEEQVQMLMDQVLEVQEVQELFWLHTQDHKKEQAEQ